ncbi:MAG: hypothetical protein K6E86_09025 [Bacteroidales bacterium]|nr:hypothetical protein [Bacteroidales bacterium]
MIVPFWVACVVMSSLASEAQARLRVTKASSSTLIAQRSLLRGNNTERYDYFCEGKYALIQRDAYGKTQVYLSTSGYVASESNRVKELDTLGIDWRYVNLYGGMEGNDVTCSNVNIKMNNGQVGSITLRGEGTNNKVTNARLNAYGGTVDYIDASSNTTASGKARITSYAYVYLSNLKYLSPSPIDTENTTYLRVFINTNCEFFERSARFSERRPCCARSLIAPDSATWTTLYAKGIDANIPSGHNVECASFVDSATSSLAVTANLKITRCDGWHSNRPITSFSRVTISPHQHLDYLTRPASCTDSALYVSKCMVCNDALPSVHSAPALGHNYVSSQSVEATCWSGGYANGKHCTRCGDVKLLPVMSKTTSHNYGHMVEISGTLLKTGCFTPSVKGEPMYLITCQDCGAYQVIGGTESHTYSSIKGAPTSVRQRAVRFQKTATCLSGGVTVTEYCTKCQALKVSYTSALGHKYEVHEPVDATCTEDGMQGYKHCSRCNQDYIADATSKDLRPIETDYLVLPALGHQFGGYVMSDQNLVSEATCTERAYYWVNCKKCGLMSNEFKTAGSPATGHKYQLRAIEGTNDCSPMDGSMVLECEHCNHMVRDLSFELCNKYGMENQDVPTGYWCKSELISTDTLPTCVDGWGTYQASVCYHGQIVRGTYENYIPACGYLHNYGEDGICHEQHYRMRVDQTTGRIQKDNNGCITYFISPWGTKVLDDSVYSTKGYTVIPFEEQYYKPSILNLGSLSISTKVPVFDPEDGSLMTYTDYLVTQYDSRADLESALANVPGPHYIGTVNPYNLTGSPILTDPNSLGVIHHGGAPNFTLADKTTYGATSDFALNRIIYTRQFSNTLWQPLYIPFSVPVSTLEAKGLQAARLNDTHMYDNDFDGDIDSVTVEFIRITSGTLIANRPYMIRSTTAGKSLSLTLFDVELAKAVDNSIECSTVDQVISIVGTYQGLGTGVMYRNNYYALNAEGGLSRAASTAATLSPQRWYMKVENKDGLPIAAEDFFAASIRVMGEWGDEEVTGIEELPTETEAEGERQVYSLDGMRVVDGQKLQRGMYVDNGRRMIVH